MPKKPQTPFEIVGSAAKSVAGGVGNALKKGAKAVVKPVLDSIDAENAIAKAKDAKYRKEAPVGAIGGTNDGAYTGPGTGEGGYVAPSKKMGTSNGYMPRSKKK